MSYLPIAIRKKQEAAERATFKTFQLAAVAA